MNSTWGESCTIIAEYICNSKLRCRSQLHRRPHEYAWQTQRSQKLSRRSVSCTMNVWYSICVVLTYSYSVADTNKQLNNVAIVLLNLNARHLFKQNLLSKVLPTKYIKTYPAGCRHTLCKCAPILRWLYIYSSLSWDHFSVIALNRLSTQLVVVLDATAKHTDKLTTSGTRQLD